MLIKALSLKNYRNLNSIAIGFNKNLNIIIGNNGQGKTNIVEAIYLLSEGESFRYCKTENLIQLNESTSLIKAKIENNNLEFDVQLRIANNKKEFFINEKRSSTSKLDYFSTVLFSPESLNVIKESSEQRRHLVDQVIGQTRKNGKILIREFKKALKMRNKLLKEISEEKIARSMGLDILESINSSYIKLAAELTYLRIKILEEIKPEVETALNKIHSENNNIIFDYNYVISDQNYKKTTLENLIDTMHKRIKELEIAELKTGVSLVGPHKHDITFLYSGNDSRFYCSQGQQRSIILAYKMAQIMYYKKLNGFYPLLLLDDVLSELDLLKQESLISTLNQTETQTFVTTTDISLLSKLSTSRASVFKVENGQVFV